MNLFFVRRSAPALWQEELYHSACRRRAPGSAVRDGDGGAMEQRRFGVYARTKKETGEANHLQERKLFFSSRTNRINRKISKV